MLMDSGFVSECIGAYDGFGRGNRHSRYGLDEAARTVDCVSVYAGICLIGIEGGVGFGAAQEASCPAVQLRIEDALQRLLNWVLKAWVVHLTL